MTDDGGPGHRLPSQQFAEVVEALRNEDSSLDDHERRRTTRISVSAPVLLGRYTAGGGGAVEDTTALTRDISIGGIGLLLGRPVDAGANLLVRLPRMSRAPLALLAKVTFCRRLADGIYTAGLAFLGEAPPAGAGSGGGGGGGAGQKT